MFDEILDLYHNYVSNNLYADNNFVNQVIVIINKYHPLGKYLHEVYVTNKKSEYLPIVKTINICLDESYKLVRRLKPLINEEEAL